MRRKFLLPALAACAMLVVGAPAASASKAHTSSASSKAIAFLLKANKNRASEIGALKDLTTGFTTAISSINSAVDTLKAQVKAILDGVPAIVNGLQALKDGLTGPGVAGQLGAAGTATPGSSNSVTPSTLPTGTVYRQIVLSAGGAFGPGAPIGGRTWMKMPDVVALGYSNTWACTSAGRTATAAASGYVIGDVACPDGHD